MWITSHSTFVPLQNTTIYWDSDTCFWPALFRMTSSIKWVLAVAISFGMGQIVLSQESGREIVRLQNAFEISPASNKALFSSLGVSPTARKCGGSAKFVKWRHESCASTLEGPCLLKASHFTRGEVTFIPVRDSPSLGVISEVRDLLRGSKELAAFKNTEIPDSSVHAGQEYTLSAQPSTTSELQGKLITARLIIYSERDKQVELCAEADFLVT